MRFGGGEFIAKNDITALSLSLRLPLSNSIYLCWPSSMATVKFASNGRSARCKCFGSFACWNADNEGSGCQCTEDATPITHKAYLGKYVCCFDRCVCALCQLKIPLNELEQILCRHKKKRHVACGSFIQSFIHLCWILINSYLTVACTE